MKKISRRTLLASSTAAALILATEKARAFPVPNAFDPVFDPPLGNWPAVAEGFADISSQIANSVTKKTYDGYWSGCLIYEAMNHETHGIAALHKAVVADMGQGLSKIAAAKLGQDVAAARNLYFLPSLRADLVEASGPDGFSTVTGEVIHPQLITMADEYVDMAPGSSLKGHCTAWIAGILARWNRLVPVTRRPAMTDEERAAFFDGELLQAGLSWRGARDFWIALPANASLEFARLGLSSWIKHGVP